MHSSQSCAPPRRCDGFSLVEIMIVTVIISLLTLLALPALQKVRRNSQSNRFVSDLRVFVQAFESYNLVNGGWPVSAGSGVVPPGMAGDFREASWTMGKNSLGGSWNWDNDSTGAAIAITNVTASDAQMIQIDAKIDDGDLTNGLFQKTSGSRFVYYLQHN